MACWLPSRAKGCSAETLQCDAGPIMRSTLGAERGMLGMIGSGLPGIGASSILRTDAGHATWRRFAVPVAAALVLTLLNAAKPLYMDDANYYQYAVHIAERPLDPYGFDVYWAPTPQPAYRILTPPLFPYWWALAIRLFGERPFLWKLFSFPFYLLFALSLQVLLRRFARGPDALLLWATALSPAILPSLNLMLDVPALALSLTALAIFVRAADRGSLVLAALAGLVCGLAMLTKYTAFTMLAVILLYALCGGRVRCGLLAASVALGLFGSWEGLVAYLYSRSHFVYHFQVLGMSRLDRRVPSLVLPLVGILGALAPSLTLSAWVALGASRRMILAGAAVAAMGYALLAYVPSHHATFLHDAVTGKPRLTLNNLVVGILGVGFWSGVVAVVRQRVRTWWEPSTRPGATGVRPESGFLVLWLVVEIAGYFSLSPYPAVRRVIGIVIAATVLIGHALSCACRCRPRHRLLRGVVIGGIVLGLGYYVVDLREAAAEKAAADAAVRLVRSRDTLGTLWYVGFWGFQYYATQAGMTPAFPTLTMLKRGDWLVIPDDPIAAQRVHLDDTQVEFVDELHVRDRIPLSTKIPYYAGRSAIAHHEGARVSIRVYRVIQDFILASSAYW
jgi:4-amino-4-deoxy-L-arabinose transferase-like glycosyltransferase